MEKQLISFETAKLLNQKDVDMWNFITLSEIPKGLNSNYNPTETQPWFLDITQTMVQKWLLDNYSIFVTTTIAYDEFGKYAAEVWGGDENMKSKLLIDGITIFQNPYDAFEEGLREALKII